MKKINSIMLIVIMTLSLVLSTTTAVYAVEDNRKEVSIIEGVSDNIDSIPVWGGNYTKPEITVTTGEPAYFLTSNGNWQRKEGDTWSDEHVSERFRAGTWRYKCRIYISNSDEYGSPDGGDTHKLAEQINVKVNGDSWKTEDTVYLNNEYNASYANVYSKEYTIDEPDDLIVYDSNKIDIGINREGIPIAEYSIAPYVEGGIKPYTFSKVSGPDWVNVSTDGTISGTPTETGKNQNLTVLIKDSSNPNRTQEIDIAVAKTEINLNNRDTISEVVATSTDIDTIPKYEGLLNKPTFTVTSGQPAYFSTTNGSWQKKENGNWKDIKSTNVFTDGIWRYRCKIYIDNNGEVTNAGYTHKLAKQISVNVNGASWEADETQFTDDSYRSIAQVYSKEYYLTKNDTYMVSFESNGGTYVEYQTVDTGKKAKKPEDPTKNGYAFAGWYSDKELKNEFDFDKQTILSHIKLYAKWLKYYTITATTSLEGVRNVEGTGKYKDGDTVTLKANVENDFYFICWEEGEQSVSTNPTYTFVVNKDRVLKAVVKKIIEYDVDFDTDGGSAVATQKVFSNNPYVTKPTNPTKNGYVFEGWYADNNFSNVFDFTNTKIVKDTIIYAKWHKHIFTNIAAKSATCMTTGNTSYYKCNACNKLYKDANGTQEITLASTVIPKTAHNPKEEVISKEKTKATLTKNGKIVRTIQTKCSVCGAIIGKKTTTETIYYPKTIKLSNKTFTYNKKAQRPTVKVKDSNGNVIDEANYTVTYSNKKSKKVGEYTVTVKFKGNYKGTKELKYTIKPQGTTLKKLKAGSKQFKATWNKNKDQTTGYQIQYATNDKFTKNSNKLLVEDNKKTSNKVKKLKSKRRYYVRIRTYKTVKGKRIYSSWSEVKTVKTKK